MPSLANSAIKLFHRLFSNAARSDVPRHGGLETVLDGNTAVAVTEACIAEAAALGGSFPAEAATLTWKAEQKRKGLNCSADILASHEPEGPRGALAAATGQAMAGVRATVFLSAPDLARAQDLLTMTAGRHLPLVIHVDNRALSTHASPLGSGHEAYHLSADSGCVMLIAHNVQEAVDLTLIARRVAEQALLPAVVVMDGEQTAMAAQEVYLPSPDLVQVYLGHPHDTIETATTAQRLLFGETRRRIPRWHDLDRPVLHGALQGPDSWALGVAAQQPYYLQTLDSILCEAFDVLDKQTGSRLDTLSVYRMENAHIVLIAQGAAVETTEAVAQYLRQSGELNIGVLGIRCLRPLPTTKLIEQLHGKPLIAVLERTGPTLGGDPPLLRELRTALSHSSSQSPTFHSVIYGQGGLSLRPADLMALCLELQSRVNEGNTRTYLGMAFTHSSSIYPKRQVLLDTLRRDYPQIANLGLKSIEAAPDLRPQNSITVAIHRISGQGRRGLAMDAAAFLHQLVGGRVRSQPSLYWSRFDAYCVERFTNSPANNGALLRDPGEQAPVDLAILDASRFHRLFNPLRDLRHGGALLFTSALEDEALWQSLPRTLREGLQQAAIKLYCLVPDSSREGDAELAKERLLGSLVGVLMDQRMLPEQTPRKVIAHRESVVKNLDTAESQLMAFNDGLTSVRKIDYESLSAPAQAAGRVVAEDRVPMAVRRLGRVDEAYDSLPRFWDQVGVLYHHGEADELTPDPYLGTGTIPPLSSSFCDLSGSRDFLPVFNPQACTGCGKCWTSCPDSAIGATAIGANALLDSGIRLAGADALRMLAGKLATGMIALAKTGDSGLITTADYTRHSYAWLQDKMPMDAERERTMEDSLDALNAQIGELPLAVTEAFLLAPEHDEKNTGAFLALTINPDACKGCLLCLEICDTDALTPGDQNTQRQMQARRLWNLWEQLPATEQTIIDRAREHEEVGEMAALMLSQETMQNMAGGDGAEAGSGERIAVRQLLGVTEYLRRPLLRDYARKVDKTRKECSDLIRKTLASALPMDDLDALAKGLESVQPGQIQLASLTQRVEAAAQRPGVDAGRLRRLVDIARRLGELNQRLHTGVHGLGRAAYGLTIAPGSISTWAGVFPDNPFQVPVAIDMSGNTPQLAAGLLEGQLREVTEGLALLRQAHLELSKPQEAVHQAGRPATLSWSDLTAEERQLCPPVILLGNDDSLGGRGLAGLIWLLGSGWPVKIVVLSDMDLGISASCMMDTPITSARNPKVNLGLLALAQRQAYVAQTSIAVPTHLQESMKEALNFPGPALINAYAPSPQRHGFAADQTLAQAKRATVSRVFPLFRYSPDRSGVFGSRIDLQGNPDPDAPWLAAQPYTPADWARGQKRFAIHFTLLADNASDATPLADYLSLTAKDQLGKTPFVSVSVNGEEPARYAVGPDMVAAAQERLHGWRTLQELAGRVTPFTAQVEQRASEMAAQSHQAELARLRQEYESRIKDLESEIAVRIQDRLMNLAGYGSVDSSQ